MHGCSLTRLGVYRWQSAASRGVANSQEGTNHVFWYSPPTPRSSPQGTPAALPYPILRRLSSTNQRRAAEVAARKGLILLANAEVLKILPHIGPFVGHKSLEHPTRKQRPYKLK